MLTRRSAAVMMAKRRAASSATPPVMSFLATNDGLLKRVGPTLDACKYLLNKLRTAKTAAEKHNLMDSTSNVLCLLLDPCEFVRQIHPDPLYKQKADEAFSLAHTFMCEVNGSRELYDHLLDIASPAGMASLDEEQRKNVRQLKRDMESNGIHLKDEQRRQVSAMNIKREEMASDFMQMGMSGKRAFTVLNELLKCRHDLAKLLEYDSFAQQQLIGTMVQTPDRVWEFLCAVASRLREGAQKELTTMSKRDGSISDEDRASIMAAVQEAFSNDGSAYFSVANCIRGIQLLCSEVFGVNLREVPFDKEEIMMEKNMKKFLAYEDNGEFLGVVVLDMFSRDTKLCQAGHLTVQLGCRPHLQELERSGIELPARQYPIVVLSCNATASTSSRNSNGTIDAENTFMAPHEVVTCFHEFGHAMHTLFGQTCVQNLAGTRGSIDYVESFSQLFEQFITSHEFLKNWAIKPGTKEPIPLDLVMRRNHALGMFQNMSSLDQVSLAAVDQTLHGPQPFVAYSPTENGSRMRHVLGKLSDCKDASAFSKLIVDVTTPLHVAAPNARNAFRMLSLDHLATYPGAYYGYLYSGAFAKEMWRRHFAANPLNKKEGQRLRKELMQYGAACTPSDVFTAYFKESVDHPEHWV